MQNVAIFGVPRSGTSWLGQLFNSSPHVAYRYQPLFSYAFKNRISENTSPQEIEAFYRDLLNTDDDFVLQNKNISGKKTPQFSKSELTHLVFKEVRYLNVIENLISNSQTMIVGIVRHPCAVLYSWFNAPREFDNNWNQMVEWRTAPQKNQNKKEEFYGFERWKETTLRFLEYRKCFPERFYLQLYEDLNANPEKCVQQLFDFTNLAMNKQTRQFIYDSTHRPSDDPYGVYRKKKYSHEWKGKLDKRIVEEVVNDDDFQYINNQLGWQLPE